jgi:tRNA 2-thiouridine synthesizing protein A
MTDITPDQVLDCKGLNCPMPVLKTKKSLDGIESGQILEVQATDKGSVSDISALCNRLGHELIESKEEGGVFTFLIKKK